MENQLFKKVPSLQIIICRRCQQGIRPVEVEQHLKKQHQLPHPNAHAISQAVQEWRDIEQDSQAINIPYFLDEPLPILPCEPSGLQCYRQDPPCQHLVSSMKAMRNHWRDVHGWSQYSHRGRVSKAQQAASQAELQQSFRCVSWQQVFRGGKGSHYIHIRFPDGVPKPPPQITPIHQAVDAMCMSWQEQQAKQQRERVIQAGQIRDANPWLRMTRWAEYLQGIDPSDLVAISTMAETRAPGSATAEIDTDAVVHVLQETMAQLVRKSQQTVQHCGHAIRIEAVRTETSQTPYRPLMAYMNPDQIQKHVQPWQQVLGVIARTQADWPWKAQRLVYGMTARQQRYWQRLWELAQQAADARASLDPMETEEMEIEGAEGALAWAMTPMETACLEFCIELLNQRYRTQEYESPLVCAMAVLGRSEKGWRDADSYPPIISRVVKVARFLLVQKALWMDPDVEGIISGWQSPTVPPGLLTTAEEALYEIDEGFAEARPPPNPSSPPSSVHSGDGMPISRIPRAGRKPFQDCVEWMVRRFMVRGTHGPMQTLLDWRTYGLKVHYNTTAPGHVTWMGQERLLYQQVQFTMGGFRGFVHGLVQASRALLGELLQEADLAAGLPVIPWDGLFDDPAEQTPGWSFLRDSRTAWPVDGARWMAERLRGEPGVQRQVMTRGRFNPRKIQQYLQQVARLLEKLAVAVHLTGGAPARAPELLSAQHVNTETNRQRNIYIEDGLVVLVTAYHKGFYASNDVKVIHRYLPQEVGALLVYYLWLLRPFVQQLAWQLARPADLPPPGPAAEPTRPAGHCSSGVEHRGLLLETITSPYLWGVDVGSGREWGPERLREVLKRETRTGLGMAMTVAHYRDIAIGISRRFLRPSSAFPNNIQQEQAAEQELAASGEDPDDWVGTIADEQAGHSAHVAGMVYGRESQEWTGSTMLRRLKFRASSMDWHQFLGFPAMTAPVLGKRANPWEEQSAAHQAERRQQLQAMDLEPVLARMTGRAMTFRGIQQPAIQAIQDGASPIVAIMPTGGGKSMLFMLPAFAAPGGCTIVVVPLLSLRADLVQRCRAAGISCVSWESRHPPDEAAIVLVTPESTEHPDFHTFVNRQRVLRRLDRIVVDECHVMLNPQKDFRPAMARLGHLVGARTQLVYLTATLPPALEATFVQRIQHPASAIGWYRARTSRRNVAYRVWRPLLDRVVPREPHQWLVTDAVVAFLQARIRQARGGRVIVYANLKSQAQAIGRALGCEAYHSMVVDRDGVLQRFQEGQTRVIAATSALGMGIDIPDIRSVIHVGRPRTLLEYGQESGRAGRDGRASEAVIIHPGGWETPDPWLGEVDAGEFARVQLFMGAQCRRYILDGYLDGTVQGYTRQQCQDQDATELACDQCDPDWAAVEELACPRSRPGVTPRHAVDGSRPISTMADRGLISTMADRGLISTMAKRGLISTPAQRDPISTVAEREPTLATAERASPVSRSRSMSSESFQSQVRRDWTPAEPPMEPELGFGRLRSSSPLGPAAGGFRSLQYEQGAVQQQAVIMHEGLHEEAGEQAARQWQDRCYTCARQGREDEHDLYSCVQEDNQVARQWMIQVRGQIRYARFQACFTCGMPQSICHGWEGEACQYRGILIPMVAQMVYGGGLEGMQIAWQRRLEQFQVPMQDTRQVITWLGQGNQHGWSHLFQEFCWLYQLQRVNG